MTAVEPRAPRSIADIPRVDAVPAPVRAGGLAYWRAVVSKRHLFTALAAFPVLLFIYGRAWLPGLLDAPLTAASVVLASVMGALVVASFVPARGAKGTAQCGGAALLALGFAAIFFTDPAMTPGMAPLAAVVVGMGVVIRLRGSQTCGR